jgi:shikimate kinase
MNLIFIYGPPGVGKLTVARELAKITGYKIFHNHQTSDLLTQYFQFGTDFFWRLSERVRLEIFKAAALQKVNLIFTGAYAKYPENDAFIRQVIDEVSSRGGHVLFVQLITNKETLLKRVRARSRLKHGKVKDPGTLEELLSKHDYFSKIPYGQQLTIDNTKVSPKRAAKMIKEHYKL